MSFLFFWVFVGGTAAVTFPIVFHLIRRTPRGRQEFSSLMFLRESPPRVTRRSRLDNLLLLFLRALVILLLALAFMRPLWRFAEDLSMVNIRGRRIAIVIDTSASMRRGNLSRQAVARAEAALDRLEAADDVALYAFDDTVHTIVGFDDDTEFDLTSKKSLIRNRLAEIRPSWAHSDLGAALVTVGEALEVTNDLKRSDAALQIVIISDMQQGSKIETLQAYQWPAHVDVDVQTVSLVDNSNAVARLLAASDDDGASDESRVRVKNAIDSTVEQFRVSWASDSTRETGDNQVAFYVPPGQSRVLQVPRGANSLDANRLNVVGDDAVFDNTFYTVPVRPQEIRLAYIGSDAADDPHGLRYYLERALTDNAWRRMTFDAYRPGDELPFLDDELPSVVVIAEAVSDKQRSDLQQYLEAGGTALVVLANGKVASSLGELLEGVEVDSDQPARGGNDYAMLGEIDFTHPLFVPLASARYNDFTKIRFWRYQRVTLRDSLARVIARFDDGRPALWEQTFPPGPAGPSGPTVNGKLIVLASSWNPDESQLALSSKFVPLLEGILEMAAHPVLVASTYTVNQSVAVPTSATSGQRIVRTPVGVERPLARAATAFTETAAPGIYSLQFDGQEQQFAVNLAASESDTAPMEIERLEQLGVKLGVQPSRAAEYERQRQLRDTELESRQKIWKLLIVLAICVLGIETCLAGWRARQPSPAAGEVT